MDGKEKRKNPFPFCLLSTVSHHVIVSFNLFESEYLKSEEEEMDDDCLKNLHLDNLINNDESTIVIRDRNSSNCMILFMVGLCWRLTTNDDK